MPRQFIINPSLRPPPANVTGTREALRAEAKGPQYGFLRGCGREELANMRRCAAVFKGCERVLVMATGASAACGRVWSAALGGGAVEFISEVSPAALAAYRFGQKDGFLFISREGETAEVMAQLAALADAYPDLARRSAVLVGDSRSSLARKADLLGLPRFLIDGRISGRFSIFNEVGLLPAMLDSVDVGGLLGSAASVVEKFLHPDNAPGREDDPAARAATIFALIKAGFNNAILAIYDPRLIPFARWLSQLYAESLGKNGKGLTPSVFSAPAAHHSQFQLWLDGPKDKFITLIDFKRPKIDAKRAKTILSPTAEKALLDEHRRLRLMATKALAEAGVPLRVVEVSDLAVPVMESMLETWSLARLMRVDPFNQPAVARLKKMPAT